jgi:hypothetical protein
VLVPDPERPVLSETSVRLQSLADGTLDFSHSLTLANKSCEKYPTGRSPRNSSSRHRLATSLDSTNCESGGIGRRTRLRIWRVKPWGFESPLSHQELSAYLDSDSFPRAIFRAYPRFSLRRAGSPLTTRNILQSEEHDEKVYVALGQNAPHSQVGKTLSRISTPIDWQSRIGSMISAQLLASLSFGGVNNKAQ